MPKCFFHDTAVPKTVETEASSQLMEVHHVLGLEILLNSAASRITAVHWSFSSKYWMSPRLCGMTFSTSLAIRLGLKRLWASFFCALSAWSLCDPRLVWAWRSSAEHKDGLCVWVQLVDGLGESIQVIFGEVTSVLCSMCIGGQLTAVLVDLPGDVGHEPTVGPGHGLVQCQLCASDAIEGAEQDHRLTIVFCGPVRRVHSPSLSGYSVLRRSPELSLAGGIATRATATGVTIGLAVPVVMLLRLALRPLILVGPASFL